MKNNNCVPVFETSYQVYKKTFGHTLYNGCTPDVNVTSNYDVTLTRKHSRALKKVALINFCRLKHEDTENPKAYQKSRRKFGMGVPKILGYLEWENASNHNIIYGQTNIEPVEPVMPADN